VKNLRKQGLKLTLFFFFFFERERGDHELMQVVECFHCFNDGHTYVKRDEHSGYPSLSRNRKVIWKVCDLVRAD